VHAGAGSGEEKKDVAMPPIIKGSRPERPAPAESHGTDERVAAIIDDAGITAAALLEDARQEVAEWVKRAGSEGQEEGFAQAEHMRDEIRGLEGRMIAEVEGEVVRTALKIAEELLANEMTKRDDAIVELVLTALQNVTGAREIYLRVNPQHVGILRKAKPRLVDALAMVKDVDVREDRKVKPGGVLIQTESGVIDATLETQLAEIARVLGA
jgi:flagellar biosynthesis/type III secretory pathway protein FliH